LDEKKADDKTKETQKMIISAKDFDKKADILSPKVIGFKVIL